MKASSYLTGSLTFFAPSVFLTIFWLNSFCNQKYINKSGIIIRIFLAFISLNAPIANVVIKEVNKSIIPTTNTFLNILSLILLHLSFSWCLMHHGSRAQEIIS